MESRSMNRTNSNGYAQQMTKKARLTSVDSQEKKEVLKDSFGQIPDDILVNIVSWLTLKEAARTSVLSRRWKYLWRFTSNLDFDGRIMSFPLPAKEQNDKYICWVNKVLKFHRGSDINKFRISCNLDDSHGSNIINWIYAAMAKKVRNLELVMWQSCNLGYTFPQEWYNSLKRGHDLSSIKSLRSLHLNNVNVSGEVLEFFIHSCPLLEDLFVGGSSDLLSLKVVGSSIPLKYLDIGYCDSMEEIEISASSLISFKCIGNDINLHVGNVPQLVDVVIHGFGFGLSQLMNFFGSIESCFPQLKTLELQCCNEALMKFRHFEFPKLIHFKLIVIKPNRQILRGLTFVLRACPFLQKFVLELGHNWWYSRRNGGRIRKKTYQVRKLAHQHLRLVEFHGFLWRELELEVANLIFENAARLEKMIIGSHNFVNPSPEALIDLKAKLPEGVELVVG